MQQLHFGINLWRLFRLSWAQHIADSFAAVHSSVAGSFAAAHSLVADSLVAVHSLVAARSPVHIAGRNLPAVHSHPAGRNLVVDNSLAAHPAGCSLPVDPLAGRSPVHTAGRYKDQ